MPLPPIFIISLKNSPRRAVIAKRLSSLNISFEFFDAIYGKDLTSYQLSEIDYEFYPKYYAARKPLTLGEIGCAMSHIQLYRRIIDNNIEQAIILEDDAIVYQDFEAIVRDILKKVPKRREIIFLEHGKAKSYPFKRNLIDGYRLVRYRSPSKSSKRSITRATGYILTLAGAKKLMNYAYPIRMPADYLTGLLQITHIHAYGVEPPCIFRGTDSEIDAIEHRDY